MTNTETHSPERIVSIMKELEESLITHHSKNHLSDTNRNEIKNTITYLAKLIVDYFEKEKELK